MATAAVKPVMISAPDLSWVEVDAPTVFEPGLMSVLAFKTLARACCGAEGLQDDWISAEESILVRQ